MMMIASKLKRHHKDLQQKQKHNTSKNDNKIKKFTVYGETFIEVLNLILPVQLHAMTDLQNSGAK